MNCFFLSKIKVAVELIFNKKENKKEGIITFPEIDVYSCKNVVLYRSERKGEQSFILQRKKSN